MRKSKAIQKNSVFL